MFNLEGTTTNASNIPTQQSQKDSTKTGGKGKKNKKEGTISNSGAQIVDGGAGKDKQKKQPDKESTTTTAVMSRKQALEKNSAEHRFEYVCNFMNIKKEEAKDLAVLDFTLDDICRLDWIVHFVSLRELTVMRQGISTMEGLDRLKFLEKLWLNHNSIDQIRTIDKCRNLKELYLGGNKIS